MAAAANQGGCLCGAVRFAITGPPMIVHACYCTRCQQRSGGPLAVNLWIEANRVALLAGEPANLGDNTDERCTESSNWGCPSCGYAVWTIYHSAPPGSLFVRAGSLDDPSAFPPDVHIFTRSRQPWLSTTDDKPSFEAYYDFREVWPQDSQQRFRNLKAEGRNAP
jgi:hypothetical protein